MAPHFIKIPGYDSLSYSSAAVIKPFSMFQISLDNNMYQFRIHRVRGPDCCLDRIPRPYLLCLLVTLTSLVIIALSLFIIIDAILELHGHWVFNPATGNQDFIQSPYTGVNYSYIAHSVLFILGSLSALFLMVIVMLRRTGGIETKRWTFGEERFRTIFVTTFHLLPYTFLTTGLIAFGNNPSNFFTILAPLFNLVCARIWFICVCNVIDEELN